MGKHNRSRGKATLDRQRSNNQTLRSVSRNGCDGKATYSFELAKLAAYRLLRLQSKLPHLGIYECGVCCGYHVTKSGIGGNRVVITQADSEDRFRRMRAEEAEERKERAAEIKASVLSICKSLKHPKAKRVKRPWFYERPTGPVSDEEMLNAEEMRNAAIRKLSKPGTQCSVTKGNLSELNLWIKTAKKFNHRRDQGLPSG